MTHQDIIDIVDRANGEGAFVFIERNVHSCSYLQVAPTPFVLGTTIAETADIGCGVLTVPSSFPANQHTPYFANIIQRVISDPTLTVLYIEDHIAAKLLVDTVRISANFEVALRC
ncbi:hypothetical protein BJ138DRAFT_1116221 [Hygrophoropsis aurantiaca]|uniref:Uncharacterized protein n=1 Tax=Hygrophoropsis aurantiaca TaxID=72124 RepID=A0ACB8A4P6_9AGAM|nr:hypothetical protein BJ138DRAFT_1116221 [Hygrophoropsis aurantiaca]